MATERKDVWASGDAYEPYVGRWSRLVGRQFVTWLGVPPNKEWLDVGAGTGALGEVILAVSSPRHVTGVDPSEGFVSFARHKVTDNRTTFQIGDAQKLSLADGSSDATVSGLVINFIPDQAKAVAEMKRVTRPGGGRCSLCLGLRRRDADDASFLERRGCPGPERRFARRGPPVSCVPSRTVGRSLSQSWAR